MKTTVLRLPEMLWFIGGSVLALAAAGCTSSSNLPVYSPGQVNQVQTVETGTVQTVRAVIIEGESGYQRSVGQSVGSSVGRGLAIGGNPGTILAGAAGSVVGSIAGSAVEKQVLRREGQEINVLLDDGTSIVVVQDNNPAYVGGERVRILRTGNRAEVVPNLPEDNYYVGSPTGR